MRIQFHLLLSIFAMCAVAGAQDHPALSVAVLHPLLGDMARQIGGSHVKILSILKPGMEVHHFEPSTKDLASLQGVRIVLASGKNMESYLDKLRDSLGASSRVVDVGGILPTLSVPGKGTDPHWWHDPENMKRAAGYIAEVFSDFDPANATEYKANAREAAKRIEALRRWAQIELLAIPPPRRVIISAHNAFGYFCQRFKFQSISILGLAEEDEASMKDISEAIKTIREHHVSAVFPEDQANPKVLGEIVRETGVKMGTPLDADGTATESGGTYEGMFRHNVEAIMKALKE